MLKDIFFGNLRVKFMALIMAVVLWFYAINKHTGEITEDVQLMINTPPGLTLLEVNSNFVTVSLSGPQNIVDRVSEMIKDNKIKVRCDFVDTSSILEDKFTQNIRLTRRNFNLPQEIRIVSITPNEVDVVFSRLANKYLKVQVQRKGLPALGYRIKNEFFYPRKVLVTGPANILENTDEISTNPIDISGITSEQNRTFPWTVNMEQSVSFIKDGKTVSVPVRCEGKIKVWLQVSEKISTKRFEKINVNILHPINYIFEVKLKEKSIDLNLKGPELTLNSLEQADITAYIDVSTLNLPGPYKQPVICNIPEGLEIDGKPPEIFVDIVEETEEENVNK